MSTYVICHLCQRQKSELDCSQDSDADFWCLDHESCNKEAAKRLGAREGKRPPGRIGGKEGKRRLEAALKACRAYRHACSWSPSFPMPPVAEEETLEELFGL